MRMSSPPRGAFSHGLSTGSHSSGRSIRGSHRLYWQQHVRAATARGEVPRSSQNAVADRCRIISPLITPPGIKTKSNVLSTRK